MDPRTEADWPWLQAEQARALAEPDGALAQFEAAWPRWPAPAAAPGWRAQLGLHLAELLLRLWRLTSWSSCCPRCTKRCRRRTMCCCRPARPCCR
ncbi:MAG: hypothetical protein U1E77_14680 [Inhella sp.]